MNLKRTIVGTSLLLFTTFSPASVIFDFIDNGATDPTEAIDGGSVGSTFFATDGIDSATFTIVDILVPEFQTVGGVTSATGNTLSAAAGDGSTTNINGNADALGINNSSVNNAEFDSLTIAGDGAEANDFNVGESLVFSFDQGITLEQIELESNSEVPSTLTIMTGGTTVVIDAVTAGDFINDPLMGLFIPANTNITFTAGGDFETDFRIESIMVGIPEPSGILFILTASGAFFARRKRRCLD